MAYLIASGTTTSVAANTLSAELVTGDFEIIGSGKLTLIALGSATGLTANLSCGGIFLSNNQPIPFFGTTGTMDTSAHVVVSQSVAGGKNSLKFRNTTAGALTVDYQLLWEPASRRR